MPDRTTSTASPDRITSTPSATPATATLAGRRPVVRDAVVMSARCARLSSRNVEALTTSLMLPVLLMLMFVYLFGGAIHTGTTYVRYVVPGVILLCAGFGSAMTAVTVSQDMTGGIVDRLRSLDVGGTAVLWGHVAASVARNAASTVLVLGVALLIGFHPTAGPLAWLGVAGILVLFIVAISALSAAIGLLAGSPEAANGFAFFVMFLPYASSAFVPVSTIHPAWLRGFAMHQPVTPLIDTLRSLLVGGHAGADPWQAVAWCIAILAVSLGVAGVAFTRRTAHGSTA
jgi:ABC-2 type transport system permease protein